MRPGLMVVVLTMSVGALAGSVSAIAQPHPASQAFADSLAALTTSVRAAEVTLDNIRVYRVLAASAPSGGSKEAAMFFTTQWRTMTTQAPGEVVEAIRRGAKLLASQFALAKTMGDVGDELSLIPDPAAAKIVLATSTAEKWVSYGSGLLGLAATALSFGQGDTRVPAGLAGGAAALLGGGSAGRAAGSGTAGAVNTGFSETMEKAREVVDKVSVHAYFSIELHSLGASLTPVEASLAALGEREVPATDSAKVKQYAADFVAAFARVDAFYDSDLPKLRTLVEERKGSPIYTEPTKRKLAGLSDSVDEALARWGDARVIYMESETAATQYLAGIR